MQEEIDNNLLDHIFNTGFDDSCFRYYWIGGHAERRTRVINSFRYVLEDKYDLNYCGTAIEDTYDEGFARGKEERFVRDLIA